MSSPSESHNSNPKKRSRSEEPILVESMELESPAKKKADLEEDVSWASPSVQTQNTDSSILLGSGSIHPSVWQAFDQEEETMTQSQFTQHSHGSQHSEFVDLTGGEDQNPSQTSFSSISSKNSSHKPPGHGSTFGTESVPLTLPFNGGDTSSSQAQILAKELASQPEQVNQLESAPPSQNIDAKSEITVDLPASSKPEPPSNSLVPPSFIDVVSNRHEWAKMATLVESNREGTAPLVVGLGILFIDNSTNHQGLEYHYEHGEYGIPDRHAIGVGLCISTSKGLPCFIRLDEADPSRKIKNSQSSQAATSQHPPQSSDVVPMEERYEFLFGLLQSSHVCKYIFDAKNSLKPFLERNRAFRPQQLRDPQIAAWVLSPESLPGFNFNQICQKYLSDTSFANYSPSANLARDIMLSMQVMATLQAQLERENLWNVYLDQEMPLVPILSLMEMDGVLFDNEQLVASERQMQEMLADLETLANRVCGFPVALSSPKQVANVIFNKIGLRPPKNKERKIASGRESTTEAILKSMASQHPLPDIVLRYRQVSKFQSNWVSSLNRRKAQGRLFSNWSQTGASTGRVISSKPNLQNLPRASLILDSVCSDRIGSIPLEKVAPSLSLARAPPSISVRSAFVAASGNVFVSADFSQLEMRLLAHVSQDPSLIEFFNEGKDIHALVAAKWKGIPLDKITDEDRTAAKRLVYGIMYGMGPVSLADHLGVGQDVAKNFLSQFLTAYPAVQLFIERTKRLARARGWVRTLFGRRRLLNYDPNIQKDYSDFASMEDDEEDGDMEDFAWGPDDAVQAEPGITQNASLSADSDARRHLVDIKRPDRQAVNSVIQGTAADIVKRAMLAIDEELRIGTTLQDGQVIPGVPEAKLILQIHDEILYECPEVAVPRVAEIIKRNMENVVSFSVPLTVQLRMGLRWGNMKSLLVPSNDMLVSAPRVATGFSDASYAMEPPSINTSFHSSMTNSTTEAPLPSGVTTMGSTGALSAEVSEGRDATSGPDAEELFSQM